MLKIFVRLMNHPDLLHHASGSGVSHRSEGDNFIKSERTESIVQCRSRAFGCVAASPMRSGETPAHLDAWVPQGVISWVQSDASYEVGDTRNFTAQRPQSWSFSRWAILSASASDSLRVSVDGNHSITRGSALSSAKAVQSSSRHRRSRSRVVLSTISPVIPRYWHCSDVTPVPPRPDVRRLTGRSHRTNRRHLERQRQTANVEWTDSIVHDVFTAR